MRDLRGVIEREKAEIGVLISLEEPTKPMRTEAATAGFYTRPAGRSIPAPANPHRGQLLEGKQIDYPPSAQVNVTFKKAPKAKSKKSEQLSLAAETPAIYEEGDAE